MEQADASITQSSAASRIPQELFDLIFHEIHESREDRSFLATCSLVCRAWVPGSRFVSFQHRLVVLHPKNIGKFRFLMRSPHATLARYIRHLAIRLKIRRLEKNIPEMRRLPPFPSIETIRLEGPACIDFAKLSPRSLHDKFQTLKYLELHSSYFDSFSSVATFLSSFPLLSHLVLNTIIWSNNDVVSPAPGSMSSLRYLSLQYGRLINWLEWLLSFSPPPMLHTLRLGFTTSLLAIHENGGAILNQLIQVLGPSLKHVHIDEHSAQTHPTPIPVDFSCSTELRTLHIEFAVQPGEIPSVEWIHVLLARICSPHVEVVTLQSYFTDGSGRYSEILHLRELDEVFSRSQFQNLQQVKFIVPGSSSAVETMIYEHMPLCHSRGLLFISQPTLDKPVHHWNWRRT
jgi:hypothetical protein